MHLPQKPVPGHLANRLHGMIKPPPNPALIQAAKSRAQAAFKKIRGGHALKSNPLFQEYLEALMTETEEGEQLKKELISRARDEFNRRRHLSSALGEVLRPFQSPGVALKFRQEVMRPANTRSVSSKGCLASLDGFFNKPPKTPILDWIESVFGPVTFGISGSAEGGAGAGIEGAAGIAFRRNNPVAVVHALTIALGAYAEATASIQGSAGGGDPSNGDSLTMDVSLSAASGVSGEVVVSLAPTLHKPTLAPEKKDWDTQKIFGGKVYQGLFLDYAFSGISVSLGVGAGLGAAIGVTWTNSILLAGPAT